MILGLRWGTQNEELGAERKGGISTSCLIRIQQSNLSGLGMHRFGMHSVLVLLSSTKIVPCPLSDE